MADLDSIFSQIEYLQQRHENANRDLQSCRDRKELVTRGLEDLAARATDLECKRQSDSLYVS
jgi:hypothetical protein